MDFSIDDSNLKGFNPAAKDTLKETCHKYTSDVIEEANRIESTRRSAKGAPEITSIMVTDAEVLIRRGLVKPKIKIWQKIIKILSVILAAITAKMYDTAKLTDGTYMLIFVAMLIVTIFIITLNVILE